jgi:hypothetical protein
LFARKLLCEQPVTAKDAASPALTRDLGTLGTLGAVDTVVSDGSPWNGKTRKASVLLRTSVAYGQQHRIFQGYKLPFTFISVSAGLNVRRLQVCVRGRVYATLVQKLHGIFCMSFSAALIRGIARLSRASLKNWAFRKEGRMSRREQVTSTVRLHVLRRPPHRTYSKHSSKAALVSSKLVSSPKCIGSDILLSSS